MTLGGWTVIRDFAGGADGAPVHGIGDEAYISTSELIVRQGIRGMSITVTGASGIYFGLAAQHQDVLAAAAEKKLALKLLARASML
ncbi:MAG: hypothetical protein ACYC91_02330 [Solirubrobacteraceae bacterium]